MKKEEERETKNRVSIRRVLIKKRLEDIKLNDILKTERKAFLPVGDFFFDSFDMAFRCMETFLKDPIPPIFDIESGAWSITYVRWDIMKGTKAVHNFAISFNNSELPRNTEQEVHAA